MSKLCASMLTILVVLATCLLLAGQTSAAPQTSQQGHEAMGATSPEAHVQMLSEKLNLTEDQKAKEIATIQAQLVKLDELEKKAETNPFRTRVTAFIEAEKAGRQDDMKRMIAEFAAIYARTN